MTDKKFNLTEKIVIKMAKELVDRKWLHVEDVAEFIRLLKEYFFDDNTMYKGKKIKQVIDTFSGTAFSNHSPQTEKSGEFIGGISASTSEDIQNNPQQKGCGKRFNEVIYGDGSDDYEICNKLNLCPECKKKTEVGDEKNT